jgi:antitoxin MazE
MHSGFSPGETLDGGDLGRHGRGFWRGLAVRIPKAVADALKVSSGKRAEITIENGTLVLRPILKPARKPRYTLDELLSGMTRDNVPHEVDWGPQRGNEAW